MAYTLGQAAKAVNRNKATLSAAIKKGRISAVKDKNGVFHIEEDELFRVYPQDSQPTGGQAADKQADKPSESNPLEVHLKVLEELVSELRADKAAAKEREAAAIRREDHLRRDLEHWQAFAFDVQQRLKAIEAPKARDEAGGPIIEAQAQEVAAPDPSPSPTEGEKKARPWWAYFFPWALLSV